MRICVDSLNRLFMVIEFPTTSLLRRQLSEKPVRVLVPIFYSTPYPEADFDGRSSYSLVVLQSQFEDYLVNGAYFRYLLRELIFIGRRNIGFFPT